MVYSNVDADRGAESVSERSPESSSGRNWWGIRRSNEDTAEDRRAFPLGRLQIRYRGLVCTDPKKRTIGTCESG